MKTPRGKLRTYRTKVVRIHGKFGLYHGDNNRKHLDFVNDAGLVNLDSVIEAVEEMDSAGLIHIETSDSVSSAKADMDFGALGCTNLDSVIEFNTVGTSGHAWKVNVIPHTSTGAGVLVNEDTVNKVLSVMFEDGVSTVTNFETAIGTTTNFAVKTGGTGANVLASGADEVYNEAPTGGVDTVSITVSHSPDGQSHEVSIGFEDSVTKVSEVETAIGALSGADAVIQVRDTGTGANVLTAADDTLVKRLLCDWKAPNQVGRGFVAARTADGKYSICLINGFVQNPDGPTIRPMQVRSLLAFKAEFEHGSAAAYPCDVKRTGPLSWGWVIPIGLYDNTASAFTETNYSTANTVAFVADVLI